MMKQNSINGSSKHGNMRIFMLVSNPNIQGPLPKITPLLAGALQDLGCEVITEAWGCHSDNENWKDKIIGRIMDLVHISRIVKSGKFDVLLIHTAHRLVPLIRDVALLWVNSKFRPVTALIFHGSEPDRLLCQGNKFLKTMSAWLMRMSDAVFVLSSYEKKQWEKFYSDGQYFVVNNPFLPVKVNTKPLSEFIPGLRNGVPVILFVGRLMPEKGIFDLLCAVNNLKDTRECHLLVVGDGSHAQQVRELVTKLDLADHVTLCGYLQGEEIQSAYHSADIFVLPTYWNEGFPTVLAEAMNAGLPIVTTKIRGIADHLKKGVNTLFVEPKNPMELSEAIGRLLSDKELCLEMSKNNLETVKQFTPDIVGSKYFEILLELVGDH